MWASLLTRLVCIVLRIFRICLVDTRGARLHESVIIFRCSGLCNEHINVVLYNERLASTCVAHTMLRSFDIGRTGGDCYIAGLVIWVVIAFVVARGLVCPYDICICRWVVLCRPCIVVYAAYCAHYSGHPAIYHIDPIFIGIGHL